MTRCDRKQMMTSSTDAHDLIDLVNRIFTAADERDCDTYRSLMLDQVYVDFAGVGPHKPGLAAADQLAATTRVALGPVVVTQHMLTNHVVTVDGDRGRVEFYEQALHHHPALGDDPEINTWFLYARASRDALRTGNGWRISAAGLTVVHQTGNRRLLADVARLGSKDPPGDPRRWWIMAVLGAVAFMATLDIYIVNVALPGIAHAFGGPSLAAGSWGVNGFTSVSAAVMVPAAGLADHLGRKQALVAGMVVFAVGSAAC